MENKELDKVPFIKLKAMVEAIENHPQMKDRLDEVEISFEYVIASLFPNILHNVHDALQYEHMQGYIEGLNTKEEKNEIKRFN